METTRPPGGDSGLARGRDASPVPGSSVRTFGAALRQLRAEHGLGTRRLAERSTVSRRAIMYLEDGSIRPRRCTIAALAYGLDPDDPERRKQIIASLVGAAGGEDALAPDRGWPRYRARRFQRGMLNGTVPLPSDIALRIELHKRADAAWHAAQALLDKPGALEDAVALSKAKRLLDEGRRLRDQAGGPIGLWVGKHRFSYGFDAP